MKIGLHSSEPWDLEAPKLRGMLMHNKVAWNADGESVSALVYLLVYHAREFSRCLQVGHVSLIQVLPSAYCSSFGGSNRRISACTKKPASMAKGHPMSNHAVPFAM